MSGGIEVLKKRDKEPMYNKNVIDNKNKEWHLSVACLTVEHLPLQQNLI